MYAIDQKAVEILDRFEETHEQLGYCRKKVDVVLENKFLRSHEDQDKIDCQCYVYQGPQEHIERLRKLPHWDNYESNGPHGLRYQVHRE